MNTPLLSVCLITYNHVKYIREAIDSVLMQKVNFPWELIIADDYSTDGTRDVLLEYKDKYPDFIRLILQDNNVGAVQNWMDLIAAPTSRYVAYLEGDDCWTDPFKLQKQFDFMNNNWGYSMCFHNAIIKYDDGSDRKPILFNPEYQKKILFIDDIINKWQISSASIFFRRDLLELPVWYKQIYNGDYALHLLLSGKGLVGYIPEVMSIYRKHQSGFSGISHNDPGFYQKRSIELFQHFQRHYKGTSVERLIIIKINKLNRYIIYQEMKKRYPFLMHIVRLKRSMFSKV